MKVSNIVKGAFGLSVFALAAFTPVNSKKPLAYNQVATADVQKAPSDIFVSKGHGCPKLHGTALRKANRHMRQIAISLKCKR